MQKRLIIIVLVILGIVFINGCTTNSPNIGSEESSGDSCHFNNACLDNCFESGQSDAALDACTETCWECEKEPEEPGEEIPEGEEWQPETDRINFEPWFNDCGNYIFTEGEYGSCSFCSPEPTSKTDLCCRPIQTCTNPTGGKAPYHFQLDTMGGFPPMGLSLNLNGMLTGTPSKAGSYDFSVCAVDISGDSDCGQAHIEVEPKEEPGFCGKGKQLVADSLSCMNDCQTDDYVDCQGRWGPVPARLTPSICAAEETAYNNCVQENCCEPIEEEPEEPEEPSGNGCFCMFTNTPCTKSSDCPPDPATGVPGGCACPA